MTATPRGSTTILLTTFALIAFAANSVLCRLALGQQAIDASAFTAIRICSGALLLLTIFYLRYQKEGKASDAHGSWLSAGMLFMYAAPFSFAYLTLDTGTGALILFGAVQITMILAALLQGNKLHLLEWAGLIIAFGGFVYLVLPGVSAPPLEGFLLMSLAGVGWGLYTLRGKGSANPLGDTAFNFARAVPLALILLVFMIKQIQLSSTGVLLAVASGAIASGLGYTIWYMALRGLSTSQAAVVQLSVPIIAAFGGVLFVAESLTMRLTIAALLILGGIGLVVLGRNKTNKVR
ncbi:MAG: DMT family transporter [Calditrichia bacterium]